MRETLFPEYRTLPGGSKVYTGAVKRLESLMPVLLKHISRIGQSQLIRRQMAFSLRFGCQLDAHLLFQALDTFNV